LRAAFDSGVLLWQGAPHFGSAALARHHYL